MAERSIAADCKSAAHAATKVRILASPPTFAGSSEGCPPKRFARRWARCFLRELRLASQFYLPARRVYRRFSRDSDPGLRSGIDFACYGQFSLSALSVLGVRANSRIGSTRLVCRSHRFSLQDLAESEALARIAFYVRTVPARPACLLRCARTSRAPCPLRNNHVQAKFDRASKRKTRFVNGFVHGLHAIPFSATKRTITSRLSLNAFQTVSHQRSIAPSRSGPAGAAITSMAVMLPLNFGSWIVGHCRFWRLSFWCAV